MPRIAHSACFLALSTAFLVTPALAQADRLQRLDQCVGDSLRVLIKNKVDPASEIARAVAFECREHLAGYEMRTAKGLTETQRAAAELIYRYEWDELVARHVAVVVRKRAFDSAP